MRRFPVFIGALSFALAVTGCSGDGKGGGSEASGLPVSAEHIPRLDMPSPQPLPFAQYSAAILSATHGDSDFVPSTYDESQEFIAACMKDEGFDFYPQPYPTVEAPSTTWADDVLPIPALPTDRSEVVQYGYGIDDVEAAEAARTADRALDENGEYYESLSPSEKTAYDIALTGSSGVNVVDPDPQGGCGGRAETKFGVEVPEDTSTQFQDLILSMYQVVSSDVISDPDVVEATQKWTSCMEDAGYELTTPSEYQFIELSGPTAAFNFAVMADESGKVDWSTIDAITDEIPIAQRYIMGYPVEREVAVADYDCRVSSNYTDVFTAALIRLENDFIVQHASELDQFTSSVALEGD